MSNYDFHVQAGTTFAPILKYSQPQLTVKTITAITNSGQAVVTATSHGLTVDWPVWITSVKGMVQINSLPDDLERPARAYQGYYVDANTMRLNLDSAAFSAYVSGGELLYHPPVDLTGYSATMVITPLGTGATPITLTSTPAAGITLGDANGQISPVISAATVAAWTWQTAKYTLNLTDGSGVVTPLASGAFIVDQV